MFKYLHFNVPPNEWEKKSLKKRFQSRTVAAEPPKSDYVYKLASAFIGRKKEEELHAIINVGVTFLSFKDRYNRKTGRQEAEKHVKMEKLKVVGVIVTESHIFIKLEKFKGVAMALRTNKATHFTTVTGELEG